ncbi:hypothetical protein SCATT_29930 [Streptantibioticus cattleyicolor NRRL 8057 = DSM 46488]|uniref:Uncharacterized protein n=1 Tax=Streptantibioticus cattleyicolor (strain ATCC 35852 / DSM 46488 / JCM 4925 / NBRC 14057 / NRRL 8057) TaxID=1003195 RepID=G8WSC4_STREN|nr:hypothetical protein SCATT_29930 [Streptantibioticus cattleyicolor NRRL 8057 = DSM 46488]
MVGGVGGGQLWSRDAAQMAEWKVEHSAMLVNFRVLGGN